MAEGKDERRSVAAAARIITQNNKACEPAAAASEGRNREEASFEIPRHNGRMNGQTDELHVFLHSSVTKGEKP